MLLNLFVASEGVRSSNLLATSFQALSFLFLFNFFTVLVVKAVIFLHFFHEASIRKLKFVRHLVFPKTWLYKLYCGIEFELFEYFGSLRSSRSGDVVDVFL